MSITGALTVGFEIGQSAHRLRVLTNKLNGFIGLLNNIDLDNAAQRAAAVKVGLATMRGGLEHIARRLGSIEDCGYTGVWLRLPPGFAKLLIRDERLPRECMQRDQGNLFKQILERAIEQYQYGEAPRLGEEIDKGLEAFAAEVRERLRLKYCPAEQAVEPAEAVSFVGEAVSA